MHVWMSECLSRKKIYSYLYQKGKEKKKHCAQFYEKIHNNYALAQYQGELY